MIAYRIYEISDSGHRTVMGWGDHSSIASAKEAILRWGEMVAWEIDDEHDAADALILPGEGLGAIQIAVEKITNGESWPTC